MSMHTRKYIFPFPTESSPSHTLPIPPGQLSPSVSFAGNTPPPLFFASGHVTSGNAGLAHHGGETIVDLLGTPEDESSCDVSSCVRKSLPLDSPQGNQCLHLNLVLFTHCLLRGVVATQKVHVLHITVCAGNLILTTTLGGRYCCFHFVGEETKVQRC